MSVSNLADTFLFDKAKQVKIKPYIGQTGNGPRVYDTERTYFCRIAETQVPIFTATGQQVVSTSAIEVYPRATDGTELIAVNVNAVVTLPDGTTPRVLKAGSVNDFEGATIYWRIMT